MWIKMLRDQVGPDGIFLKGQTVSLPTNILKKLAPDSYVEVEMDEEAMLRLGVEDRLRHLDSELVTLDAAVESTKDRLADLYRRRKAIRSKVKQANDELKQAAEAKAETDAVPVSKEPDKQKQESKNEKVCPLSRPPGNVQEGPGAGPASSNSPASA